MNIDFRKSSRFGSHILYGSTLINIWKLAVDNNFKIISHFLPKFLLVIPFAILNIPFIYLEKILYNRKIRQTEIKSPIFILGYPRSGTTFLMYLMSKDPRFAFCKFYECMGPHVMFTFGGVLRFIASKVLPKTRPMDNLELGADVPKEEEFALGNMGIESMANAIYFPTNFSNYFDRFVLFKGDPSDRQNFSNNIIWLFKKLTLKNNHKQLLLKSPFNTGRVKLLLELFPDAKFIHIHRHPYSVYCSNEKLYESVMPQVAFQEIGNTEMENHIFYTYKETMKQYFEDRKLLTKENLYEMRYADFVKHPLELLKDIYAQLNISDFDKVKSLYADELKNYKNYQTNIHKDDELKKAKVYDEWKFVYETLGYARSNQQPEASDWSKRNTDLTDLTDGH